MKILATFMFSILFSFSAFAQDFSVAGNLGWAIPGGSAIGDAAEDLNLQGGLTWSADALYHLTPEFGVGLTYVSSALAGAGGGDIDIFGMRLIGAKGLYRLKDEGFSPYGGLSLGFAQLLTPEFSISSGGETTVIPEKNGGGFGIMPELGIAIGGFQISASYLVPTKYTIEDVVTDKSVGTLNINLGYRYNFGF